MKKITSLLLFAAILSLAASCGFDSEEPQGPAQIKAMKIQLRTVAEVFEYPAQLRGIQDVEIYPQVSGTITSINVKEGQLITKGQVLFVINQVPFIAAFETAKADLDAAKAAVATAELTYENYKVLYEKNVVSKYQMMVNYNQMLSAKAAKAQAEAALLKAREDLSFTEVKSPVNGIVGVLPYKAGALVGPQISEPLTTVSDNSQIEAVFSISEAFYLMYSKHLNSDDMVRSASEDTQDLRLKLKDNSIFEYHGTLETLSGVIDPGTGSLNVKALFKNPDHLLVSGGTGKVLISYSEPGSIVIPRTAVKELQDKNFVLKVVDGKTAMTEIDVVRLNGTKSGKEYMVTGGLKEGDVILVEGVAKTADGVEVVPVLDGAKEITNAPAQPEAE